MTTATTNAAATTNAPAPIGRHELVGINVATLQDWRKDANTVVIDVREDFEHAIEHIHGSVLRPLSTFDPAAVRDEFRGKRIVFYCRSGRRSGDAGNRYRFCTEGAEPIFHLDGGITARKAAAQPVDRLATAPKLDVMRQVQMAVGFPVVLGTVLGAFVSPWFLLLSGFVGGGLFFAGATGTYGMAMLLGKMSSNRVPGGMTSCASCIN